MRRFFNVATHFFISLFIVFSLQVKWQGKTLETHILDRSLVETFSEQIRPVAEMLSSFLKKGKKKLKKGTERI